MFYYKLDNNLLISDVEYKDLTAVNEDAASRYPGAIYALNYITTGKSRKSFCVSRPSLLFLKSEGLELLRNPEHSLGEIPGWLMSKIDSREVISLNTSYPDWQDVLKHSHPSMWRINITGLGDVGGILSAGLRMMSGDCISRIGLYDIDDNKIKRWENETGQIMSAFDNNYPDVCAITEEQLFDCDMFVFCVSVGVPPVGKESYDVRMAQFDGNSRVIKMYARKARQQGFKGIFAVVSDPVDLLCKVVLNESNTDEIGNMDYKGLGPEQIRGYGLGVMNGRAAFFAKKDSHTAHFLSDGRVFGPHGEGLVVADSIENYDDELSKLLTQKARNANLEVRSSGFKPYIAPALSSGSLSIIATIKGHWHYSATFMGGVFMGSKNRLLRSGVELETLDIPDRLWIRLKDTYEALGKII